MFTNKIKAMKMLHNHNKLMKLWIFVEPPIAYFFLPSNLPGLSFLTFLYVLTPNENFGALFKTTLSGLYVPGAKNYFL